MDEGQRWANREWYRIRQLMDELEDHRCDAATMDMFHGGLINWVRNTLGFTQTFVDMDGVERDATNIFEGLEDKRTTDDIVSQNMRILLNREIRTFHATYCFFGNMPRPRPERLAYDYIFRVM
jgi:hypothetical protein